MPSGTYLPTLPSGFVTNIVIGGANLSGSIDLKSVQIDSSGNQNIGAFQCTIIDRTNSTVVKDKDFVQAWDANQQLFKGFIDSRRPVARGPGREIQIVAHGIESELDTNFIVEYNRTTDESDKQRIAWLLDGFASLKLYNSGWGSTDLTKVQTLRASMPNQKFKNMTVRQVLESILGLASDSSDYFIDGSGRLHTFDSTHPEGDAAPYVIRVAPTLGANEVAPEGDYDPEWDSQGLFNMYRVRAKLKILDNWVSDAASIAQYGRFQAVVDAPDANTNDKVTAVGNAALKDNAAPKVRGQFQISSPYDVNGTLGWKVGQMVTLWSAIHGLTGQSSRIVSVHMEYQSGDGRRVLTVQHGGDRLRLRTQGTGNNTAAASVTGQLG